jgi:hypothetical protein
MSISVVPAYGRDYQSQAAVKAAWNEGKDFVVPSVFDHGGRYINKQDVSPGVRVVVRYAAQRKQCVIVN